MKKSIKLALFGVGLFALSGLGVGLALKNEAKPIEPTVVFAEGDEPTDSDPTDSEPTEPEVIELPCKVVIEPVKHGSVSVSIEEGNIGDICVITAKHDILYKVAGASVNGTALIESETTSGEFSFALMEGENKITVAFDVDEELCGSLTAIVREASEKDWTNLFSVENVITLVKWLLDGGILIAIIRYYVKDKRLEKKLENTVSASMKEMVPEITKTTVVEAVEKVVTPLFSETKADYIQIMQGLNVFAKCMALSQENTPESRRAILDELSGLKIGDLETIGEVKRYIEKMVEEHNKAYEETLAAIKELSEKQKGFVKAEKIEEEPKKIENTVVIDNKQATE